MRSASSTGSSALDGICPFMTGEVNNALPAMLSLSLSCDLATRVICNQRESSYRLLISIWCAIMSEFSIKGLWIKMASIGTCFPSFGDLKGVTGPLMIAW